MKKREQAYISLPMVTTIGLILILSLLFLFKDSLMRRDMASVSQLRTDRHQREESLLRALVAVLPGKVAACMQADYADTPTHSWSQIFTEAVAISGIATSLTSAEKGALGLDVLRSADVADVNEVNPDGSSMITAWITDLQDTPGRVTPGVDQYDDQFTSAGLAAKMAPLLTGSAYHMTADASRPIVGLVKQYSPASPTGLLADPASYPDFNLIAYPNIRFSYAVPGEPFVAKRNWWAFKIRYPDAPAASARTYVLSLYEVPSQRPIESSFLTAIGRHEDSTVWDPSKIQIAGSIFADSFQAEGGFGSSGLSGRRSINLLNGATVEDVTFDNSFDALGMREQLQAQLGRAALPFSVSANASRMIFMPLQPGAGFLKRSTAPSLSAWDLYMAGADRCKIIVRVLAMDSLVQQTPTSIQVRFLNLAGTGTLDVTLSPPSEGAPGGDLIPFKTELPTGINRACLALYPNLLNAWLQANGGAGVALNSSICVELDTPSATNFIRPPSEQVQAEDMCVILRKGKDLRDYVRGLSVIAPMRLYIGDDLNAEPLPIPAGSGLDPAAPFYPPLSLFSAELRYGTVAFNRPVAHVGRIGTLTAGSTAAWQPLELRSGSDDGVHAADIDADLQPLRSPAELPPVYQMNWLIVLEELPE